MMLVIRTDLPRLFNLEQFDLLSSTQFGSKGKCSYNKVGGNKYILITHQDVTMM